MKTITADDVAFFRQWMEEASDENNDGDRRAKLVSKLILEDMAELSVNVEEWNEEGFVVLDEGSETTQDFDHARESAKVVRESLGWKVDKVKASAG